MCGCAFFNVMPTLFFPPFADRLVLTDWPSITIESSPRQTAPPNTNTKTHTNGRLHGRRLLFKQNNDHPTRHQHTHIHTPTHTHQPTNKQTTTGSIVIGFLFGCASALLFKHVDIRHSIYEMGVYLLLAYIPSLFSAVRFLLGGRC